MSLLREIQNTLVEPDCDLPSLLRKCKMLAHRLDSSEFKIWLENESSGYKSKDELPDYRILHVQSKGNFMNSLGKKIINRPIPMGNIPEDYRTDLSYVYFTAPISELNSLVSCSENNFITQYWDSDIVAHLEQKIYKDMTATEIKKIMPKGKVNAILDEVKNRILNFVLELEKESPQMNDNKDSTPNLSNDVVTQIFNTTIHGTVQNLATGSHHFKQIANNPELFDNLIKIAQKIESKAISEEFVDHIENMKNSNDKESFKSSYNGFMASLANHATVAGFFVPFLASLSTLL